MDVELSRGPVEARQLVLRDACYALRGSTPNTALIGGVPLLEACEYHYYHQLVPRPGT